MHRTLVLALALLCAPSISRADPIQFQFGVSPSFTIVAAQEASIQAALINTGTSAFEFGCAHDICGGLNVAAGFVQSGMPDHVFNFGPSGTVPYTPFFDQFVGLTLNPGERLDFVFGRLTVFAPLGTEFHTLFGFSLGSGSGAFVSSIGRIGTDVRFSPPKFVDFPTPVPEPTTLLLMGSGVAYLLRWRRSTHAS